MSGTRWHLAHGLHATFGWRVAAAFSGRIVLKLSVWLVSGTRHAGNESRERIGIRQYAIVDWPETEDERKHEGEEL
jgi:hypothetical protein